MSWRTAGLFIPALLSAASAGQLQFQEKVRYGGWQNCIRLSNGQIEIIVTTDVGPRVIRCGFVGGQNLFHEVKEELGKTGGSEWRPYGGHRLWHAPEQMPRTYAPDNGPVQYAWDGKTLTLTQPVEPSTGIQKQMEITLSPDSNHLELVHRLINKNLWDIEAAPWCLTVMAPGGRAIFPQEPYIPTQSIYCPPARWYCGTTRTCAIRAGYGAPATSSLSRTQPFQKTIRANRKWECSISRAGRLTC